MLAAIIMTLLLLLPGPCLASHGMDCTIQLHEVTVDWQARYTSRINPIFFRVTQDTADDVYW